MKRLIHITALMLALTAGVSYADTIRLYPHAMTTSNTVELGQIAVLEGSAAEAMSGVVVAEWPGDNQAMRVSLDQIRQRLSDAGINWGQVSLEGAAHCTIKQRNVKTQAQSHNAPETQAAQVTHAGSDHASPATTTTNATAHSASTPAAASHTPTLRREIEARLRLASPHPSETLRIAFPLNEPWLDEPITGPTILRPLTQVTLGTLIIVVERLDTEGEILDRRQIRALIERESLALTATRPLRPGQTLAAEDITTTTVWLDNAHAQPLTEATSLIGRRVKLALHEGDVLYSDHIQAPYVIRRGDLVTVRVVTGGLVVRSVAKAQHDAAMGEPVELRRPRTGERFEAIVVGPREATLRLETAQPTPLSEAQPTAPRLDALGSTVDRLLTEARR
ncbi:MAG: flagellar basal body P-ring formation chaperone FlgA [Planctomycetota bacterium]